MINYNGNIVSKEDKEISYNNRGLQYGDALFETLRISKGKILFWEDHYFRLMSSMRILRMEIPMSFTMEFLESEIFKTLKVKENISQNFRVKILINRKEGGKYTPKTNEVDYMISYEILNDSNYKLIEEPYKVELFKDYFVLSSLLSTLKTTSKMPNILGGIFAKENEYDNCILLNEKKQVVEALNGNIFLVKGNKVTTPPLADGCLKGVLRKQIIDICKKSAQFTLVEESISPFDFNKADELFITNVITGIQVVTNYRKKVFENKVAKFFVQKINENQKLD